MWFSNRRARLRKHANSQLSALNPGLANLSSSFPTQFGQHTTSLNTRPDSCTTSAPFSSSFQWASTGYPSINSVQSNLHNQNSYNYHLTPPLLSSTSSASLSPPSSTSMSPSSLSPIQSNMSSSTTAHYTYPSLIDPSNQLPAAVTSGSANLNLSQQSLNQNSYGNVGISGAAGYPSHPPHHAISDNTQWRADSQLKPLGWDAYR